MCRGTSVTLGIGGKPRLDARRIARRASSRLLECFDPTLPFAIVDWNAPY
jgi:hypothetical protein